MGTVVLPCIIVIILGAELGAFLGQGLPELPVDGRVDYPVPAGLRRKLTI